MWSTKSEKLVKYHRNNKIIFKKAKKKQKKVKKNTKKIRNMKERLSNHTHIPVVRVGQRLYFVSAKKRITKKSYCYCLHSYFDIFYPADYEYNFFFKKIVKLKYNLYKKIVKTNCSINIIIQ